MGVYKIFDDFANGNLASEDWKHNGVVSTLKIESDKGLGTWRLICIELEPDEERISALYLLVLFSPEGAVFLAVNREGSKEWRDVYLPIDSLEDEA